MGPPNDPLQAREAEVAIDMQMNSLSVISWDGTGHSYLHAGQGTPNSDRRKVQRSPTETLQNSRNSTSFSKALKKMNDHNFQLTEELGPRHGLNVGHPSFIQSNMGTLPGWFCMARHPANTAIVIWQSTWLCCTAHLSPPSSLTSCSGFSPQKTFK